MGISLLVVASEYVYQKCLTDALHLQQQHVDDDRPVYVPIAPNHMSFSPSLARINSTVTVMLASIYMLSDELVLFHHTRRRLTPKTLL